MRSIALFQFELVEGYVKQISAYETKCYFCFNQGHVSDYHFLHPMRSYIMFTFPNKLADLSTSSNEAVPFEISA